MNAYFAMVATEAYQQLYLEFLLEHYAELNFPYPFPVSLGFLASPVLMERQSFLAFNEEDELIGAMGYIHGTGERDYEDPEIVQIQAVLLREDVRGTRLFLEGLHYVTQYIAQSGREVRELRFWVPADADPRLRRLCGKLAARTATSDSVFGPLDEYRAAFTAWRDYTAQFRLLTHF